METDVLNIEYHPDEREIRECLKWILKDNSMIYGEECWLDKDKEDYIEGEKQGNIVDMIFSDFIAHDLIALELKGKYIPKKKTLEQVKTYRKFADSTYLICSGNDFDNNFIEECKKLGVGVVSLSISTKKILESKHESLTKINKKHLLKLNKSYFFDLLRKFNYPVNKSDLYWSTFDKYASLLLKCDSEKLVDEWKRCWLNQITYSGENPYIATHDNKRLIFQGHGITSWFTDDGQYILNAFGEIRTYNSFVDFRHKLITIKEDIEEMLNRTKEIGTTIKMKDERF